MEKDQVSLIRERERERARSVPITAKSEILLNFFTFTGAFFIILLYNMETGACQFTRHLFCSFNHRDAENSEKRLEFLILSVNSVASVVSFVRGFFQESLCELRDLCGFLRKSSLLTLII
jgi:hypothetical protein